MEHQYHPDRRDFLKKASLGGLFALGIPGIVSAALAKEKAPKISLKEGDTVLFQGDSITDAGRKRDETQANNGKALGGGYAFLAACELLYDHAGKNLQIYNKGVSGNKVYQLAERWEEDCLKLQPDVLSILIGVNDYWHKHNGRYDGTVEVYSKDYRALLERTRKQFPNIRLIIGEPFAVKGIKAVDDTWYPDFDGYRSAAREIAAEFGAAFIPYQRVFDQAQRSAPGVYWTHDGVHPSPAGAALMAHAWLETVK